MGYFKIDRALFDHYLWEDKPFSKGQAWIDLIGLANYEDGKTIYKNQVTVCKRGTVNRSISYLSRRWGWSRDKTRSFLSLLESDNMITIKATTNHTTITIENYGKFQDSHTTNQATNRQRTSQRTDSAPYKEIRRIKKNKEREEIYMATATQFSPPSVESVREYCEKRQNGIDPEQFVSYYDARDWKLSRGQVMTDWKAQVRYWERNRKQKQAEKTDVEHPSQRDLYNELEDEIFGN